jgi:hypothetical protein
MSNVVVTLGRVVFQDFEVPEKIGFGGTQRLAVQSLIGGGRVVDVLGEDAAEIKFSGIFSGTEAVPRAQSLDAARAGGAVLPLYWDAFYYRVVIADFVADYEKPWWIPFGIRCVVTTDVADFGIVPTATLIANDLSYAATLFGQAGLALAGFSNPTVAGLSVARGVIGDGLVRTGAALVSGAVALNGAGNAPAGIAAVNQVAASAGALAALSNISGYVGRAASNLVGSLL